MINGALAKAKLKVQQTVGRMRSENTKYGNCG